MSDTVLGSQEDASVNFITEGNFPGKIEARYVRRSQDYFVCYLSSMTGCDKACRMCFLTQMGETKYENVPITAYVEQARKVFEHYRTQEPAEVVHFNFMSRGEVLANPIVLNNGSELLRVLGSMAADYGVIPKFKFSTIMPLEMKKKRLSQLFQPYNPDIYYSIYSVQDTFRKRWLPKSMPVLDALHKLKEYQEDSHKIIKLHWAFIEGENDSEVSVGEIAQAVSNLGLRVDINIVRYNPYSPVQGKEPPLSIIEDRVKYLKFLLPESEVKVIGRVGLDVYASCGTFVPK